MAILLEKYKARCIEHRNEYIFEVSEELRISCKGYTGILLIYESEQKYPGMKFIVFHSKAGTLHTSPGKLVVNSEYAKLTLITQQNNIVSFQILKKIKLIDNSLLH